MDYIIKKREQNNVTQYLVKWTGKTHNQNTWVTMNQIKQQPNYQFLKSSYADNQQKPQRNEKKARGRRILKQKAKNYTIKLGTPKLIIPCLQKSQTHWIYGDRVQKVLYRNNTLKKYNVKWQNAHQSWQNQDQLLIKQPKNMCLFFQKELNLQF